MRGAVVMDRKIALFVCVTLAALAPSARAIDVFAKGSVSRSYISEDKWTISVSAAAGFSFAISDPIRIEARYTNISSLQNKLEVVSGTLIGTLSDIATETEIYSLGIDISFLGPRSKFQPFLFVGAGYLVTKRSYTFTDAGTLVSSDYVEPIQKGVSGNVGLGFRWMLAKRFAIEIELFGYSTDIDKPNPLINLYGTAGVRVSI